MRKIHARALEKNYLTARSLIEMAKEIRRASLRLAPLLYPTFRAPIPIEKRAELYDRLFMGVGELMKVPEMVRFLVEKGDTTAATFLVEAWVKAIVEVLRVWDDLSGGIVDVAEVVSSSQQEYGAEEATGITGEVGEFEDEGAGVNRKETVKISDGDGDTGKTHDGRGKRGRRTRRSNK